MTESPKASVLEQKFFRALSPAECVGHIDKMKSAVTALRELRSDTTQKEIENAAQRAAVKIWSVMVTYKTMPLNHKGKEKVHKLLVHAIDALSVLDPNIIGDLLRLMKNQLKDLFNETNSKKHLSSHER